MKHSKVCPTCGKKLSIPLEAIETYKGGATIAEVCAEYLCGQSTLLASLHRLGVPITPRSSDMDYNTRNVDIIAILKAGGTLEAAGEKHGITRERVRQIANMSGLGPVPRRVIRKAKSQPSTA